MNTKGRWILLTSSLALAFSATLVGCGADDSGGGAGGASTGGVTGTTGGVTGTTGGNTGTTGGNTGTTGGNGGTTSTGGNGGSTAATGGSAGTSGTTCVQPISSTTNCTAACTGDDCGIHNLGLRDCACPTPGSPYVCDSCSMAGVTASIIEAPTTPLTDCTMADGPMEDRTDCTTANDGERCQSLAGATRFCACYNLTWDCASKPNEWP
jgi:hypothetical protein